jgi:N-acylneuraminate cytidylyltransferase
VTKGESLRLRVVDALLLLQPTSPFRTQKTLRKGVELFVKNDQKSVLGVSPCNDHPMWAFKLEANHLIPFIPVHGLGTRSQDLPAAYIVNGSFYLISPTELRTRRSFVSKETIPLIIDSPREALDIDAEWDWTIAEAVVGQVSGTVT